MLSRKVWSFSQLLTTFWKSVKLNMHYGSRASTTKTDLLLKNSWLMAKYASQQFRATPGNGFSWKYLLFMRTFSFVLYTYPNPDSILGSMMKRLWKIKCYAKSSSNIRKSTFAKTLRSMMRTIKKVYWSCLLTLFIQRLKMPTKLTSLCSQRMLNKLNCNWWD